MNESAAKDIFDPKAPEVPADWQILDFDEAISTISDQGRRVKQRNYLGEGQIPVIDQGQDFIGGFTSDKKMLYEGELPVVIFGDHTRAVKFVDRPFAVGADGVKLLRPNRIRNPKYLYYLLQSLPLPSRGYSRHFQFLKRFKIPVAPEDQQDRIVAEIEKQFSRLDEAVASLKRVKANLKRYKAAVLKAAVEGKLTEEWRKHNPDVEPASKLLERILAERRTKWEETELAKMKAKGKELKNSKRKETYADIDVSNIDLKRPVPETWCNVAIGQVFEVAVGATPSRREPAYWNGGIPWVSSGEVGFCKICETRETISAEGLANSSTKMNPIGTVLLGMIGEGKTRGQVAILEIEASNNQNSAAIRVGETEVLPMYLYYFLVSQYEETRRRGSGGNQPALNKSRVQQIAFPLPPVAEQVEIVFEIERLLSMEDAVFEALEKSNRKAFSCRQAFLSRVFSGALNVEVQNCA